VPGEVRRFLGHRLPLRPLRRPRRPRRRWDGWRPPPPVARGRARGRYWGYGATWRRRRELRPSWPRAPCGWA